MLHLNSSSSSFILLPHIKTRHFPCLPTLLQHLHDHLANNFYWSTMLWMQDAPWPDTLPILTWYPNRLNTPDTSWYTNVVRVVSLVSTMQRNAVDIFTCACVTILSSCCPWCQKSLPQSQMWAFIKQNKAENGAQKIKHIWLIF